MKKIRILFYFHVYKLFWYKGKQTATYWYQTLSFLKHHPTPLKKISESLLMKYYSIHKKQHEHVIHLKCKYLHNYIVASMIISTLNTWNNKHYISFVYCKFWPVLPKEMPKKLSHKSNTILSRDIFLAEKIIWDEFKMSRIRWLNVVLCNII